MKGVEGERYMINAGFAKKQTKITCKQNSTLGFDNCGLPFQPKKQRFRVNVRFRPLEL